MLPRRHGPEDLRVRGMDLFGGLGTGTGTPPSHTVVMCIGLHVCPRPSTRCSKASVSR